MIYGSRRIVAGALLVASPAFVGCSQEVPRTLPDVPNVAASHYPSTEPENGNYYTEANQRATDAYVESITERAEAIEHIRDRGEFLITLYCNYGQILQSELKVSPDRALGNFDIRSTAIKKVYGQLALKNQVNDLGDFYKAAYDSCPNDLPEPRDIAEQNG